ncbi:hypothetical protein BJX99DRAFT_254692 [Aspergillus californicus]
MGNVSPKRPQGSEPASRSITLPKRPRSDESKPSEPDVTATDKGRREDSAPSAAKARNGPVADESDDDDYTSSSGSSLTSSDEEDDEEDDDVHSEIADVDSSAQSRERETNDPALNGSEQIPSLPARRKPNIRKFQGDSSLLSKISAFLPQMKSANEDLQREVDAGNVKEIVQLDNEDEDQGDGQYIEMNLGLGVLEEQRSNDEQGSGEGNKPQHSEPSEETDLLDKLMGKKASSSDKPSIQELGE